MSNNTSATGGYLSPLVVTPPTEDADLDAQLQLMVVGITGLDGTLVRPRWQPTIPKQPDATTNWCAIGVVSIDPDATSAIIHHSENDGSDEMQRHEHIDVLASFYGPNAYNYAVVLRDGLTIPQNREALFFNGIALIEANKIVSLPELNNQQWIKRADITVSLRRIVIRTYAVENLLIAQGTIHATANGISVLTENFEAGE